jgi:hypothetical protein
MKHLQPLFLVALLLLAGMTSRAQIYTYTNDTVGAYSTVAANATGTALTRVNGTVRPGSPCSTGFSTTSYTSTTTFATTLGGFEATVTAASGYSLSVTGFSVGLRRSGTGPASVRLAYSTDGGASWTDKGTNDAPGTGGCGTTTTSSWTTAVTVPSTNTLMFRVYGFNASSLAGTLQALNLTIAGTVTGGSTATDSITTGAATFGPFCAGAASAISVPFTHTGTAGTYYVQLSNAAGVFPANATANIISAGSATSPISASINTTAGAGYRVRVVSQSPAYYTSGDNGSDILVRAAVTPSVSIAASTTSLCAGTTISVDTTATANGGSIWSIQYFQNGNSIGTGTPQSNITVANGDSIYARYTSNAACAAPATVSSNVLHFTVYQPDNVTVYDTICPGASYSFNGSQLTTSGMYHGTFTNVHGCDSMVMLMLEVLTTKRTVMDAQICQGDQYDFNGRPLTIAGTYNDTIRCDSIVILNLSYKTVQHTVIDALICQGDQYDFNGRPLTIAGSYADTVRCDSIVDLNLSYKTVLRTALSVSICPGTQYDFGGVPRSTSGIYADTVRCDSIVTLTLTVKTLQTTALTASICAGDVYNFNGRSLTTAGTYRDTIRCDSIVTLALSIRSVHQTDVLDTICAGDVYNFNGRSLTVAGVYRDTVRCDSIVNLTLTVNALPVVTWPISGVYDTIICIDQNLGSQNFVLLTGGLPAGGTYSGYGVSHDTLYLSNFAHTFDTAIVLTYSYTAATGCRASSSHTVRLNACLGVNHIEELAAIRAIPNPSMGSFTLETSGSKGAHYSVYDMLGNIVAESEINSDRQSVTLPANAAGVYTLLVQQHNHSKALRLVIQK